MIERWFNVFTYRRGAWVPIIIPEAEHLWTWLVAMHTLPPVIVVKR